MINLSCWVTRSARFRHDRRPFGHAIGEVPVGCQYPHDTASCNPALGGYMGHVLRCRRKKYRKASSSSTPTTSQNPAHASSQKHVSLHPTADHMSYCCTSWEAYAGSLRAGATNRRARPDHSRPHRRPRRSVSTNACMIVHKHRHGEESDASRSKAWVPRPRRPVNAHHLNAAVGLLLRTVVRFRPRPEAPACSARLAPNGCGRTLELKRLPWN
jgi:hypothetical protein